MPMKSVLISVIHLVPSETERLKLGPFQVGDDESIREAMG